jgi:hypothetical protein
VEILSVRQPANPGIRSERLLGKIYSKAADRQDHPQMGQRGRSAVFPSTLGLFLDGCSRPSVLACAITNIRRSPMFLTRSIALAIAAASVAILFASSEPGIAQDADAIRAKCLNQVTSAYPNSNPDQTNRQGLELYITCMRQHGLQP